MDRNVYLYVCMYVYAAGYWLNYSTRVLIHTVSQRDCADIVEIVDFQKKKKNTTWTNIFQYGIEFPNDSRLRFPGKNSYVYNTKKKKKKPAPI